MDKKKSVFRLKRRKFFHYPHWNSLISTLCLICCVLHPTDKKVQQLSEFPQKLPPYTAVLLLKTDADLYIIMSFVSDLGNIALVSSRSGNARSVNAASIHKSKI